MPPKAKAVRVHIRDAVRVILDDIHTWYNKLPAQALLYGEDKVRRMSPNALARLREREFGTLPNTPQAALRFLKEKFVDHGHTLMMLEHDISEFSSEAESQTSKATVAVDLQRPVNATKNKFKQYKDKYGYTVKSEASQEL